MVLGEAWGTQDLMVIDEGIRLLTEQMILFAVVDKWAGGGRDGVAMRTQLNL